jgi:hypothetical protein
MSSTSGYSVDLFQFHSQFDIELCLSSNVHNSLRVCTLVFASVDDLDFEFNLDHNFLLNGDSILSGTDFVSGARG